MAKEKIISINKLEALLEENIVTVPLEGVEDVEIKIRKILPLKDMLQFVEDVVSSCVDKETGLYSPEIKKFSIRSGILTYYANFRLPQNVEKQYGLVYNTNAMEQVMHHINLDQLEEILEAIDARIEHERSMIASVVAIKTNELLARIETFAEQFENMFSGLDNDDVGGAFKALSTMENVDEDALAKVVMEAHRPVANKPSFSDSNIIALPKKEL